MEITEEIIKKTSEMIEDHLTQHADQIGLAFSENDEILEIKLKARFSFNRGKFKIQTGINFVTDRVKDDSVIWYDPDQAQFNFNFNGSPADDGEADAGEDDDAIQ
jgi:hypothetical protein